MASKATKGAPLSGRAAMVAVLKAKRNKPTKAAEIAKLAIPLAPGLKGETPKATLLAILATENLRASGLFERVAPGTYRLRVAAKPKASSKPASKSKPKATAKATAKVAA